MIYNLTGVERSFAEGARRSVALRNVSLHVPPGDQVALLGPSGSGKTTLFRLLNATIFPSAGKLLYRSSDVSAMSHARLREMRRRVGCIYQQHHLVPGMSALMNTLSGALGRWGISGTLGNLISPRAVEVERAEHCLETVGLKDKRHARCDQLSGGQQQRVAIARTLMQQPDVILADEPVSSLDPVLSDEILELLFQLAEQANLTLLISLHQVELARRHAKRVVGLREGEIVFDLPKEKLNDPDLEQLYQRARADRAQGAPVPFADRAENSLGTDAGQKRASRR